MIAVATWEVVDPVVADGLEEAVAEVEVEVLVDVEAREGVVVGADRVLI